MLFSQNYPFFHSLCAKKFFGEICGLFCVELFTGEDVDISRIPEFREMAGDGTGLNELDERIACSVGLFQSKVEDRRFAVFSHLY